MIRKIIGDGTQSLVVFVMDSRVGYLGRLYLRNISKKTIGKASKGTLAFCADLLRWDAVSES
jgi:hypothetical protein